MAHGQRILSLAVGDEFLLDGRHLVVTGSWCGPNASTLEDLRAQFGGSCYVLQTCSGLDDGNVRIVLCDEVA